MAWMMVGWISPPPGAPTTVSTCPPFRTNVGEMVVDRVRQRDREGARTLSGVNWKPESLRKKPDTDAPDPLTELLVWVSDTAFPSASTTEMCVVSPPSLPSSALPE